MNDVPLREYLESLLDVKFEALGRALEVAQLELDRRLGQLNELHTVMLEDRHQFVTNEKVEMLLGRAEGTHTEFATRLDSLEKMKEWVGTAEDPPGSNNIFVTRWYMDRPGGYTSASKGPPYCMMTVSKAYRDVGAHWFTTLRTGDRWAYVPTFLNDARAGRYDLSLTREPRPGDPVLFDWDGGVPDHVGLFEAWIVKGSTFISVEGNTRDGIFRRDNARFPARSMGDVEAFVHVGR